MGWSSGRGRRSRLIRGGDEARIQFLLRVQHWREIAVQPCDVTLFLGANKTPAEHFLGSGGLENKFCSSLENLTIIGEGTADIHWLNLADKSVRGAELILLFKAGDVLKDASSGWY